MGPTGREIRIEDKNDKNVNEREKEGGKTRLSLKTYTKK